MARSRAARFRLRSKRSSLCGHCFLAWRSLRPLPGSCFGAAGRSLPLLTSDSRLRPRMSWLYESQLVIVALGVALILALGAAWSATGRKELLYAMGVVFILLVACLINERLVVLDREAIRATVLKI